MRIDNIYDDSNNTILRIFLYGILLLYINTMFTVETHTPTHQTIFFLNTFKYNM